MTALPASHFTAAAPVIDLAARAMRADDSRDVETDAGDTATVYLDHDWDRIDGAWECTARAVAVEIDGKLFAHGDIATGLLWRDITMIEDESARDAEEARPDCEADSRAWLFD